METLDLGEAADFLKMNPEVLRRKAKLNQVPARKTGKRWVFLDEHLAEWLKGDYSIQRRELRVVDTKKEYKQKCQSTNAVKTKRGGFNSLHQTADEYNKLLGLE
jgi:hypothetical protein